MLSRQSFTRLVATTGIVASSVLLAAPAYARGGDVRKSVTCSRGSIATLKLAPRDGAIETEFEVDSNVVGQRWSTRISDNGTVVFSGARTTVAPSGSFTIEKRIPNRPGTDRVVGRATYAGTGESCTVSLSI
ncbi:MAG: hypothetical protein QOI55_1483 [Actinomycetota bacterium]|nr:hypothetical protein [Actinomycetota bacterium]